MYQQFYDGSDLLIWPLVGLGIFVISFVIVLLYVLVFMRKGDQLDRIASLPLEEDGSVATAQEACGNE